MAIQFEVAFKINQSLEQAEKLLIENGFEKMFKTITHDIYFGKNVNLDNCSENEIKASLIRCRNFTSLENLHIFDSSLPNRVKVDFSTLTSYLQKFVESGYEVIFDTKKIDWVYKKGECYHQLQDIEKIGLLDYVENKEISSLSKEQQFNEIKKQMLEMGFSLQHELGVDKLRSLYHNKLMFSYDQTAVYEEQKEKE